MLGSSIINICTFPGVFFNFNEQKSENVIVLSV